MVNPVFEKIKVFEIAPESLTIVNVASGTRAWLLANATSVPKVNCKRCSPSVKT